MPNKNSSFSYRWMEEVWNKGREEAIDEMMDTNVVVHGVDIKTPGIAGFKTFFHEFRQQFPQIHLEVEDVVAEADHETSRCKVNATDANGQHVHFTGMTWVRLSNGKIVEGWNSFDFMGMYQQLGFKMSPPKAAIA